VSSGGKEKRGERRAAFCPLISSPHGRRRVREEKERKGKKGEKGLAPSFVGSMARIPLGRGGGKKEGGEGGMTEKLHGPAFSYFVSLLDLRTRLQGGKKKKEKKGGGKKRGGRRETYVRKRLITISG